MSERSPRNGIGGLPDHAATVREALKFASLPTWDDVAQESALAALDALVAERDEARARLRGVTPSSVTTLIDRAEAAEADRDRLAAALRWMTIEWAKWAEDTTGDPTPELVEGGIEMAMEAALAGETPDA